MFWLPNMAESEDIMNKRVRSNLQCINRSNELIEGVINLFVADNETIEQAIDNAKKWLISEGNSGIQINPVIQ